MMPTKLNWRQGGTAPGLKLSPTDWLGYHGDQLRAHIEASAGGFIVNVWPCAGAAGSCPVDSIEAGKAYANKRGLTLHDRCAVYVITVEGGQVTGIASDGDGMAARFVIVDHDTDGSPDETTIKLGRHRVGIVEEIPAIALKYVAKVVAAMEG